MNTIFTALNSAGLKVVANTASKGPSGIPSKIINATYAGWPLILSEFASHAQLLQATKFDPADKNRIGDPPYSIVGLNILIEFGPRSGKSGITPPDAPFVQAAQKIVAVLDPLLGPLQQRSAAPLRLPVATPPPTSSPSPSPSATQKPSGSPKTTAKPKATPKPSG